MSNSENKTPKAMRVITGVICIILAIVLASNLMVIIKGALNPDRPPSVAGFTSMIVMSGSMSGDAPDHIEVGDMIITKSVDPATLEIGDVITYIENGKTTVTHRIIGINEDGTFSTKGDANDSVDQVPIKQEEVIGKFWFRIPKLGDVALFAQTPVGMLLFIGIPLLLYILLDVFIKSKQNKKNKQLKADEEEEKAKLERELAELRAKVAQEDGAEDNAECTMQNAETEE